SQTFRPLFGRRTPILISHASILRLSLSQNSSMRSFAAHVSLFSVRTRAPCERGCLLAVFLHDAFHAMSYVGTLLMTEGCGFVSGVSRRLRARLTDHIPVLSDAFDRGTRTSLRTESQNRHCR